MVLLRVRSQKSEVRSQKVRLTSHACPESRSFLRQAQDERHRWVLRLTVFILIAHCSLLIAEVKAEEKVYRINIEGMHCKTCVYRVTKSLKKLKQIKDVDVNLDEGIATVKLNDGEDVSPDVLEEAVSDSGYKPNGIEAVNREP